MKIPKSIRDLYSSLRENAGLLEKEVNELLHDYCAKKKWQFNIRCKEEISFAQKLETGIYTVKEKIDDFLACEIIVSNLTQIEDVKAYVRNTFQIIAEKPDFIQRPSEFSFDGIRIYAKVKSGIAGPKPYAWMQFEIQIKTLLEKAWGDATHDFTYKCKDMQWAKERLVYQMRALLVHADMVLADTESLSKNPLLSKSYDVYVELNEITEWIIQNWEEADCPQNMKRLSETIQKLCKDYNVSFGDLKNMITTYRTEHGSFRNLSIYSSILQALFDTQNQSFLQKAREYGTNKNYPNRKILKLIIPSEVEIQHEVRESLNKERCVFIDAFEL